MALVWASSCLPLRLRPGRREVVLTIMAVAAFLYTPRPGLEDVRELAGREFTSQDVILLGFDSISSSDAAPFLRQYAPSSGTKVVYASAATSVSLTGGAWRTVLSGRMPRADQVWPGTIWPADRSAWLPAELERRAYRPVFLQDDPTTNVFGKGESLSISEPQGWQAAFREIAWNVMFPLSTAGGRWWVRVMGGPDMEPGQFAYCPSCFMNSVLERLVREARQGPVFLAAHTCHAHFPTRLSLSESLEVKDWWTRTPAHFNGGGSPVLGGALAGRDDTAAIRARSVVGLLRHTLIALDHAGVLGHATVFVLSDHGPRGPAVPPEITRNVMLAAFLPGDRRDMVVEEPVSLADIAPTVRVRLGLDAPATDGVPLPADGGWRARPGPARDLSMRENPFERFDLWQADRALLRKLVTLNDDGTFEIDKTVFGRIKAGPRQTVAGPAP